MKQNEPEGREKRLSMVNSQTQRTLPKSNPSSSFFSPSKYTLKDKTSKTKEYHFTLNVLKNWLKL